MTFMPSVDVGYRVDYIVDASELNGNNIGSVIQFRHEMPAGRVHTLVTGELRQVYHTSGEVVLNICSHIEDTGGSMAEFTFLPSDRIAFMMVD